MSYFKAKMYQIRFWVGPLGYLTGPYLDLRGLLLRGGRKGKERGKAARDTGKGSLPKKNGDSPPTIFGLKVALPAVTQS